MQKYNWQSLWKYTLLLTSLSCDSSNALSLCFACVLLLFSRSVSIACGAREHPAELASRSNLPPRKLSPIYDCGVLDCPAAATPPAAAACPPSAAACSPSAAVAAGELPPGPSCCPATLDCPAAATPPAAAACPPAAAACGPSAAVAAGEFPPPCLKSQRLCSRFHAKWCGCPF